MISLYLVEHPFAIGARRGVGEPCNRLKFNGNARTESLISGPTGLARTSRGALALLMIKVVPKPGSSEFQLASRRTCGISAIDACNRWDNEPDHFAIRKKFPAKKPENKKNSLAVRNLR
jgi:hypothetical protein